MNVFNVKKTALDLYPESWIESVEVKGFRHDNNASKRAVAEEVINHVNTLIDNDASYRVMRAFYRREHNTEPASDDSM